MAVVKSFSTNKIIMSAANDEVTGKYEIAFFRYIEATTIAHQAILKDSLGNVLFESTANVVNGVDVQPFSANKPVNGIKLTTLDSGKVEIYLR